MTEDLDTYVGDRPRTRWHRAWLVAAVTLGALVAAAAFRSSTGVLLEPVESEFGWSRATTSGAVSLNLVLYGLAAPFAAAVMERWGVRRTVATSLVVVGVASGLTTVMTAPWQLWLLWGLLIGIGTGAMALVLGAIVANRWFHTHRGLVTGIFSAANATGQLVFLPVIARTAEDAGWRAAALIVSGLALVVAVLVALLLRDRPEDHGLLPYGLDPGSTEATTTRTPSTVSPAVVAVRVLRRAGRTWTFWALVLTFWVCGWSTNGIIQTHFIPAAHDHGMPATTAAGLLAVVGIFDIAGTIGSGWLTDKVDPRLLLVGYYGGRGLSLLALDAVLAPGVEPAMWVFIVFYGLDWVATVPPTVALCRTHFGLQDSGVVFGWVFASHMVGAGVGASVAGWVRTSQGDYHWAWLFAAVLCFAAVAIALSIPRRPPADVDTPAYPT
ncbi:MFS transporter [Oryzobacter terrae]|uniref:MFS transporter n=1 Tax=Oryzobacter terrae TaxID=1620385 RepID=UPI0036723DD0